MSDVGRSEKLTLNKVGASSDNEWRIGQNTNLVQGDNYEDLVENIPETLSVNQQKHRDFEEEENAAIEEVACQANAPEVHTQVRWLYDRQALRHLTRFDVYVNPFDTFMVEKSEPLSNFQTEM